jgi:hypothetical protein
MMRGVINVEQIASYIKPYVIAELRNIGICSSFYALYFTYPNNSQVGKCLTKGLDDSYVNNMWFCQGYQVDWKM